MKNIGLVAEYNPFHAGHARQLAALRALYGPETRIAVALSGNFVQRGEAAVFDKFARARAAVDCGADLVLELPVAWATASAEGFAFGAVALLGALGCLEGLAFGSECGDLARLRAVAALLRDPALDARVREALRAGVGYAAARQTAAEALAGEALPELRRRNDILALEYLNALHRLDAKLQPAALLRDGRFPAASALRRRAGFWEQTPEGARAVFRAEVARGRGPVRTEALETAILACLRRMTAEDYARLPGAAEGLENRLRRAASSARSLEELTRAVTTRRYPAARARRMALAAFLGVEQGMCEARPPYIRVLAMSGRGQALLREASPTLPLVTKPARGKGNAVFELEARAGDLYALAYPGARNRGGGRDYRVSPYVRAEE